MLLNCLAFAEYGLRAGARRRISQRTQAKAWRQAGVVAEHEGRRTQ